MKDYYVLSDQDIFDGETDNIFLKTFKNKSINIISNEKIVKTTLENYRKNSENKKETLQISGISEQNIRSVFAQTKIFRYPVFYFNKLQTQSTINKIKYYSGYYHIPFEIHFISGYKNLLLKTTADIFLGYSTYYEKNNKKTLVNYSVNPYQNIEKIEVSLNGEVLKTWAKKDITGNSLSFSFLSGEIENNIIPIEFNIVIEGDSHTYIVYYNKNDPDEKNYLMVSQYNYENYLDKIVPVKKIQVNQLDTINLLDYKTIIFDGTSIKNIGNELSQFINELYKKGLVNYWFLGNNGSIGEKGDNPLIEEILPVELTPKNLEYDPSAEIGLLLDISSSMLGDKLSLAKVSLLELVKNLKDRDSVSIIAFWDKYLKIMEKIPKNDAGNHIDISSITAIGGTDLYPPLEDMLSIVSTSEKETKHVIIISDGKTKESDFNQLILYAKLNNISVSVIGIGEDINFDLLSKISLATKGNFYQVNSFDTIPKIIFQDRNKITRQPFSAEDFFIYDFNSDYIGKVNGMCLYNPKENGFVLLKNQYQDPLLYYKREYNGYQIFFGSDFYGTFTDDLLQNRYFQELLEIIFKSSQKSDYSPVSISESAHNITFSMKNNFAGRPEISIYFKNKLMNNQKMEKKLFSYFSSQLNLPEKGIYDCLIEENGKILSKFQFYYNDLDEGVDYDSIIYALKYKNRLQFKIIEQKNVYLILFFLISLFITYFLKRQK